MKVILINSLIIFLTTFIQYSFAQKQIIINELSQGPHDDYEWIEYIVLEDGTDIRGVYLDDNDVIHGTLGSAPLVQLKKDLPAFESVNRGAIIVIYKSPDSTWFNGQDPKLFEAGAPDTDFSDDVIIIPHTNTEYLESGSWWPMFRSEGENLGIFDSLGIGIFGMSYGNESPEGDFSEGWGIVNLLDIPYHGVGFYSGVLASTAYDSTLWGISWSSLGTPGTTNVGQGTIPVELISFSAAYVNNEILLQWKTATELNSFGFYIERSENKVDWKRIGFLSGSGNSIEQKTYKYIDTDINFNATYYYRLKQVDFNGSSEFSKIIEINPLLVNSFNLEQNYPNPFNPTTTIRFSLPDKANLSLIIFNSLGEEITTLHQGYLEAGIHSFYFDGSQLSSGVYIYELSDGINVQNKKMLLIK